MRYNCRDFVQLFSATQPILDPIYEFGSLDVGHAVEGFADLRPFFKGHPYVGCDMRAGVGVDKVLDLHALDLPDETAGMVISMDTFEHVANPFVAANEIHRIIKPEGVLIMSVPFAFKIHDYPYDYWRYTPAGLAVILKSFPFIRIITEGETDNPHTVYGIASKNPNYDLENFLWGYGQLNQARKETLKQFGMNPDDEQLMKMVTNGGTS